MRIVVVAVASVLALVAGHAAAEACKHRGKVLFRREAGPIAGVSDGSVPHSQLVIYATGAWGRVQEMPDDQEPASQGGCLTRHHLKELKRALGKAKFRHDTTRSPCDAVPTVDVLYASPSRKKKVRTEEPCGRPLDVRTEHLIECAGLVDDTASKAEITAICRGKRR